MSNSRRTDTAEFKQEAVLLVTKQDLSLAEAARRLGIHPKLCGPGSGERPPACRE